MHNIYLDIIYYFFNNDAYNIIYFYVAWSFHTDFIIIYYEKHKICEHIIAIFIEHNNVIIYEIRLRIQIDIWI